MPVNIETSRHAWVGAVLLCVAFLMAMLSSCAHQSSGSGPGGKALLDRVWPHVPSSKSPLSERDQGYAEAELAQYLQTYLRNEYRIIDRRYFWGTKDRNSWSAIVKAHAATITNDWGGVWIEQPWRGFENVELWRVDVGGKPHYFAIAMTEYPVPGAGKRRLIGRFQLERSTD